MSGDAAPGEAAGAAAPRRLEPTIDAFGAWRPTVLVTRPRAAAVATARRLHAAGFRALIDPLLTVWTVPHGPIAAAGVAALLLTSANGALGFEPGLAGLPVLAVGRATAAAARRRGWARVESADGDAAALAALVRGRFAPGDGALLHLAGEEVKPGLMEALEAAGYGFRRVVVYRADPSTALAPRTRRALAAGALDAVLLFSPRTAALFAELVAAGGLGPRLASTRAFCLGPDVAARVRHLPWAALEVAERRCQDALLDRLERAAFAAPGG